MQKWEYLIARAEDGRIQYVNGRELPDWKKGNLWNSFSTLGDEGWELVAIDWNTHCYFFKRPKAE